MDVCLNDRELERLPIRKAARVRGFPWLVKIKQGSKGQTQSEKTRVWSRADRHTALHCADSKKKRKEKVIDI